MHKQAMKPMGSLCLRLDISFLSGHSGAALLEDLVLSTESLILQFCIKTANLQMPDKATDQTNQNRESELYSGSN